MNPLDDKEFMEAFKDLIKKKIDEINVHAKAARETTELTLVAIKKVSLN